jgi:ATP-dependent helicase/nuclease subunit B
VSTVPRAAQAYFRKTPERAARLDELRTKAVISRGRLSAETVREMYGERLRLSASRVDLFSSCRFSYFLQYGLKAKPRKKAAFDPPEMGTFMHFVLEKVAGEVMESGGFKNFSKQQIQ